MRLLFLLTFLYSFPVLSHQTSITSSQKEIKWNYSNVPIKVLNNSTTLSSITTANLIDQAIAEWNGASSFKLQKVSASNNQIRFVSNFAMYGSAVVGVTEVNYNTAGTINTASILLNEENYDFTATPGMALGNNIYLKDVVTHELGHFVGLGHSEVLNSSMFYQNFPGQSELAADDIAGVKSKYSSGHGKISGHVQGGNHIGILGVHVQAISRKNGEVVSSISDEDGFFEIDGLDLNDTYYIYTSKLKNLNSLPSYLANVQTEYCPTSYVGSFFSQCGRENDGIAQGVSLTSSQKNMYVGVISINCGLRIQENYVYEKLQNVFGSLEVFNYGLEPRMEKTHVGFFKPSELTTAGLTFPGFTAGEKLTIDLSGYALPNNKFLKLRLISQPLGNAVEYAMTVNGTSFYGKTFNTEGTYKLDLVATEALSINAASNVFELEIKAKSLTGFSTSYSIPNFVTFGSVDDLPYLLVMSIETIAGPEIDTGLILSDNASCLDAPFTYVVQKSTAKSDEETAAKAATAATCATIDPPSGPGSGPGQFLGVLCLGFLLSTLPSRLVKRHKKILS